MRCDICSDEWDDLLPLDGCQRTLRVCFECLHPRPLRVLQGRGYFGLFLVKHYDGRETTRLEPVGGWAEDRHGFWKPLFIGRPDALTWELDAHTCLDLVQIFHESEQPDADDYRNWIAEFKAAQAEEEKYRRKRFEEERAEREKSS